MKKVIMYFMLLFSIGFKAQTTIVNKFGTDDINVDISIYKDGEEVKQFYSKNEISLADLKPDTYTYKTETNYVGTIDTRITNTTLELNCAKLEIEIVDTQNTPITNTDFEIYEDGDLIQRDRTNNEGKCSFYLKPSVKYAYKTKFCSGSIEIPEGKEGSITNLTINNINRLQITAKYKDMPIEERFTLYPYQDQEHPLSSLVYTDEKSGKMSFYVDAKGSYWVKTSCGAFSEPFTLTADNSQFYLEHYKVTFISNSKDPNILEEFKVSKVNAVESKITDGKGHVVFYLIPGTYSYSHNNGSGTFTVEKSDKIINIESNKQTISFTDTSGKPFKNLHIKIYDKTGYNGITKEYITNEYGQIDVVRSGKSSMYLDIEDYVSGYAIYSQEDTTIQLTRCTFESILSDKDYIYLSGNKISKNIKSGESTLLLPGNYTYSHYHDGSMLFREKQLHVESDIYIKDEFNKLTIYKHSKDGGVAGYNNTINLYNYNSNEIVASKDADIDGYCIFYVPSDTYIVKYNSSKQDTIINVNEDTFVEIITPNNVVLNITDNGQPYNGIVWFTQNFGVWPISEQCKNGKVSIPLDEGEPYFIMLASMYTTNYSKITIYNNMNLDFTDVKILSEGPGLTFPLNSTQEPVSQKYLIGSTVRLCGIPMDGYRCAYWIINGTTYNSDIIELQIDNKTTATAYFVSDTNTNVDGSFVSNMDISIWEGQIKFPQKIKGDVCIYNTNGYLIKKIYVISDHMRIDDLTPGFYVLSVKTEQGLYATKFTIK